MSGLLLLMLLALIGFLCMMVVLGVVLWLVRRRQSAVVPSQVEAPRRPFE